jgi:multidrug efflux pump subunit AcrB
MARMNFWAKRLLDNMDNGYENTLKTCLKHKKLVIFGVIGFSLVSLILFKFIGTEFFPESDESQFTVTVKLPVGSRIEETEKFVTKIENIIKDNVPEVQTIISDMGVPGARSGSLFGSNSGEHMAGIQVSISPPDERKRSVFEIMNSLRPKLQSIPGGQIYGSTGGFLKFLMNFGSSAPIDVAILGYDFDASYKLTQQISEIVKSTQGATDVNITRDLNLPEIRVFVDRIKAGSLGISVQQVANTVSGAISGTVASLYSDPKTGNQYNILVRLSENYRDQVEDVKNLTLVTPSGNTVKLENIADIKMTNTPVQIDRKFQQRLVEVTANVSGRDLGSVAKDIQEKLKYVEIPSGFDVQMSGNIEQQNKTFRDLMLAFCLAIVLVYMIMASQFQSLVDPFVIMFSVPLGIVGVLWMLFLTGTTLSVTSFEGVIVMVGIVVSNGILLIDYTNKLRKRGLELNEAIVKGGKTRLRPIIMTTLATVLGLIPMAVGIGGESSQAPLAIAVIGGLSLSTFLTLIFVPTLYTVFESRFKREVVKDGSEDI